jgi:hypothetical protein
VEEKQELSVDAQSGKDVLMACKELSELHDQLAKFSNELARFKGTVDEHPALIMNQAVTQGLKPIRAVVDIFIEAITATNAMQDATEK